MTDDERADRLADLEAALEAAVDELDWLTQVWNACEGVRPADREYPDGPAARPE